MNSLNLSQRLSHVADDVLTYSEAPRRLADIGTDHAYLPCALMLAGHLDFAIAGDVAEGPLSSAQEEVERQGLSGRIEVRLGDGLEVVKPEDQINVVTICGMGGRLISQILAEGREALPAGHLLVLQANMANYPLRTWLDEHSYEIIDESIVKEGKHFYEIIVAKHRQGRQASLSDQARYLGPIQQIKQGENFIALWQAERQSLQYILNSLQSAKEIDEERVCKVKQWIEYIDEVLT